MRLGWWMRSWTYSDSRFGLIPPLTETEALILCVPGKGSYSKSLPADAGGKAGLGHLAAPLS